VQRIQASTSPVPDSASIRDGPDALGKRGLLVDRYGIPTGLAVSEANTHEVKLAKPTLENMPMGIFERR
jgi:hypothetical protein